MGFLATVLVLLSISGVSTHNAYYVRPTNSSILSCPGQPCLTLGQYTQQASKYFTAGSTFVFLAGNHTGVGAINIGNVSGVTLKSSSSSYILCCNGFTIVCYNVNHFTIEGLSFIYSSEFPRMSAMEILNSWNVLISHSMFVGMGNLSQPPTRAVNCTHSNITITGCHFEGNTADHGGAIHTSSRSNVTLTDNVFIRNAANISGGAIFAYKYADLSLINNLFLLNSAVHTGGAVNCKECSLSMTVNNSFQCNSAHNAGGGLQMMKGNITTSGIVLVSYNNASIGGGMFVHDSNVALNGSFVMFRRNSANSGGALHIGKKGAHGYKKSSYVVSSAENLYFTENVATQSGGAITVKYSSLILGTGPSLVYFTNNSGVSYGGALFSFVSNITITGNSSFTNNYLKSDHSSHGGAIRVTQSNFTLGGYSIFTGNKAAFGGALRAIHSYVYLKGLRAVFENNTAATGGAIHCEDSAMIFYTQQVWFSSNTAQEMGGAVAINDNNDSMPVNISGNFDHNIAGECGGGVFMQRVKHILFINISITNNTGSGICLSLSKAGFVHRALIANNTGSFGGGMHSDNSKMSFPHGATFAGNKANFGGSIYSVYGKVDISGDTVFMHNTAQRDGGAMFALCTDIMLNSTIHFTSNSAQNGGAICLKSSATVSISAQFHLSTSHNHAAEYGGVVYSEDNTVPSQCNYKSTKLHTKSDAALLPYCFLHLAEFIHDSVMVDSYHDLAGKDGHFLYGGLFDRCRVPILNSDESVTKYDFRKVFTFHTETSYTNTSSRIIASQPYQLCFCTSEGEYNCFNSTNIEVYRGQEFTVQSVALDQMGDLTSTSVAARTNPETWVHREQRIQNIYQKCTNTKYQLYSMKTYDELILHPDGPCRDEGYARAVIIVTFRSCPAGFMQSRGECVCEERLQKYHANCTINAESSIMRSAESHFWIGTVYKNNSFHGLILYRSCPVDYCRTGNVAISLQDLNSQCDHKHAGVLCGSCQTNHSFLLGSSHCGECPNSFHLALLLPFAAAGIALVVFLSLLRLTVATGMINSIILYANIVQINRSAYFPSKETNVLTVFVAWINLDLGFETCFYDGMTARAQTWLQFAFPAYVWVLISLIILASRYSITVSKLIGRNPVAVLATLLLMSYAKIVKVGIDVYSFARLDYPGNETVIVWLKDGNDPYLDPLQLLLTVVTSLILVILFLPYTLLLLLGYKLYHFTDRKFMKWLNRLKPLLDSYYAPYHSHTRYWTGFLLLVRFTLYVVFSFDTSIYSHTAVIIAFAAIASLSWITGRIYSKRYTNVLEVATYFNLIVLSALTLAGHNSAALVYFLVGAVFATTGGIVVLHFAHLQMVAACLNKLQRLHSTATLITDSTPVSRMPTTTRPVTRTEVCLREPLLDN